MTKRFFQGVWIFLLSAALFVPAFADEANSNTEKAQDISDKSTNAVFHPISPGPADGRIALVTASMLENHQYLRQKFNDNISSKFLDRYLESLDPQHLHFLQSDLDEFEQYRNTLDDLTRNSNAKPACQIFNRFMERLQQRVAYADQLLKSETFQFDSDERIMINRHEMPYPKNIDEAKQLWNERLRFEYLQEKLGKIHKKKADSAAKSSGSQSDKPEAKPKTESEEIVDTLTRRYNRNIRMFVDWNNSDVLQVYLSALARVYDPHSDYLGSASGQLDSFSIGMSLRLFGIGAELLSDDGYCTIRRLLLGGPAEKSKKINVGDRIVAVAQGDEPPVDVIEMNLSKAVQLIRGPKGTKVKLTIVPKGGDASASKVLTLVRDEIKLEDQEAKAKVIEVPTTGTAANLRLGVIDLPSFYATFDINPREKSEAKSTTADVAGLLRKLKQENVGGVILDLRRNGGGSLEEAIRLTGLFIKEGPVVQVRDTDGTVQEDSDNDPTVLYDGPLIVLTSRFSASASEIVAGALQDYGRALIVGDSCTHGKGTVQSVNQLRPYMGSFTNDPGALKLTIKKFYRASGASTQLKGVTPDLLLPSVADESKDIGESALENPLPYDTIASARYDKLNLVSPYVSELAKRSAERIANDPEYAYIKEDIEQFKKTQADKTMSLNEKERLKEKEEAEARQKVRDKERLARAESPDKVHELTLRQVNLPGLPPPVEKTNSMAKASNRANPSVGLVSTNSDSASVSARTSAPLPADTNFEDDAEEEKPTPVDAALIETEHILVDYLAMLSKEKVLTAGH